MMSTYELHTATNGLSKSDRSRICPVARSRLRCGARSNPRLMVSLRIGWGTVELRSATDDGVVGTTHRKQKTPRSVRGVLVAEPRPSPCLGGARASARYAT